MSLALTVWTFLLQNKLQVAKTITDFLALIETHFDRKVKSIRSDNGTEIVMEQYLNLFAEKGIFHENMFLMFLNKMEELGGNISIYWRCLELLGFMQYYLKSYGELDCLLAATHVINKLPTNVLQRKSPYEVLFHKVPSYDNLGVFGCLYYAYNMKVNKDKFDNRSRKCIFLEYPYGQNAYKVYDCKHIHALFQETLYFLK